MIRRLIVLGLSSLMAAPFAWADGPGPQLRAPRPTPVRAEALPTPGPAGDDVMRVDLSAAGAQRLTLPRGKSAIVDLPVDARDVLVTNPKVADAVLRSPRRIYVLGVSSGQTDAVFFDAAGRRILSLDIRVGQDSGALADTINRILPGAHVSVEPLGDGVVLTGMVANPSDADRAAQIARKFLAVGAPTTSGAADDPVLNLLAVAGKDQVMLKVRIVEVQRSVIKQLGFNTSAILGQLGETQYVIANAPGYAINGRLLGGLNGGWQVDTTKQPISQVPCVGNDYSKLCPVITRDNSVVPNGDTAKITDTAGSPGLNKAQAMMQAFERTGLVKTLAEPNLTTVSGEAARFLAGGEFPIPVSQDNNTVTVEYKSFGVGLGFTPVVLSSGRISLKLSTEVSEISGEGAFSIGGNGANTQLTVPGLNVRRAETVVELPSGGSMMIAGLLRETDRQAIDALPGMTQLPVLGGLFRSRDYQKGETELVIMVTPYIVAPVAPDTLQSPADGLKIASDLETVLLGRLNKTASEAKAAKKGVKAAPPPKLQGQVIQ